MQGIRLNRNLLKVLRGQDEDIESYRFYIIARSVFLYRSGIFSLDELCDILHKDYAYMSLHRGPGNGRSPFKRKLSALFSASILFSETPDGRYIANSERKLLNRFKGTDKSSWYEFPESEILESKGKFKDFCIGVLLTGNKFRSNKKIASYCGCTVRRVQLATAENHKKHLFIKRYNFIDEKTGTKKQIERERALLFNIHGISSPHPVKYKGEWILRLNAPNTYRSFVLSGVKGFKAQPTEMTVRKRVSWFKPVRQKDRQLSFWDDHPVRWVFNDSVYNFDTYVQDNSKFLNEGASCA